MNALAIADLRPTLALAAIAALLVAAAAWPWLHEPAAGRPPAPGTRPVSEAATIAALPPLAHFAVIAERPLFSPSRRPSAVGNAPAAAVTGLRYRLVGIVAEGSKRHALLAEPAASHLREVGLGSTFDGWTVTRIEQDRVILSGPSGAATLSLRTAGAPVKR